MRGQISSRIAALATLGFTSLAYASCGSSSCSDTISVLYVDSSNVYIRLTSGLTGLTNCTPNSSIYITVPKTDPNYNSYYAMLLTARVTGVAVQLRTNDGSVGCALAYMTM